MGSPRGKEAVGVEARGQACGNAVRLGDRGPSQGCLCSRKPRTILLPSSVVHLVVQMIFLSKK